MKVAVKVKMFFRAQVEVIQSPDAEFGDSVGITPHFQPELEFINLQRLPEKNHQEIKQMMVDLLREAEWTV